MSPSIPGMDALIADVAAGRLRGTEAFDEIVARIAAHETPVDATPVERQATIEQVVRVVSQDRALCKLVFASSEPAPIPLVSQRGASAPPPSEDRADDEDFGDDEEFEDDDELGDAVVPLPLTDEEIDAELEAIEREREARRGGGDEFGAPQRRGQLIGALGLAAVVVLGGLGWYLTRADTCDKLIKRICLEGTTKSCEMAAFSKALEEHGVGEDKCVSVTAALDTAVEGKNNTERPLAFDKALVEALGFDPRGDQAPTPPEPKPEGPPPPTVVVEGQLGMADLYLDNAYVYWTSTQPPGVFRVRNIGGPIEAFGTQPDAIDVTPTQDFVYWVARAATGGQVWVDKVRGAHDPSPIAMEGVSPQRAVFGGGEVVFIDALSGAVMVAPVSGGPPRVLVPGRPAADAKPAPGAPAGPAALPTEVAADDANVFLSSPAPVSTVWVVPRDGQAPARALATGQVQPRTLTLDDTHVYWFEASSGSITRVPKTGGVPEILATGQAGAGGMALDGDHVYWTNGPSGTVHAVPKSGGELITVASGLSTPRFVAVDQVAIFWESGGAVFRQTR